MKRFRKLLPAALVVMMVIAGGKGIAETEESVDLGNMIITATKTQKEIKNVASSVEVITRQEIESSSADSVEDLVGQYAGAYTANEQDFLEWRGTVKLRGLDTEDGRTLVLVDGMLLNNGESGSANFNTIDLANVERVEVVRGAGSTLYGTDAMGGIINIITKKPSKQWNGAVEFKGGALETYEEKVNVNGSTGRLDLLFSGSRMRTGGFNGSLPADFEPGAEDNYAMEQDFFLKGVGHVGEADTTHTFTTGLYNDERHQGEITMPAVNPEGNQVSFDTQRFQLGYDNPGQKFSARASVFYNLENYERLWDRGSSSKIVDLDRLNYGLDSTLTWLMGRHELSVGASYSVAGQEGFDDYYYYNNAASVNNAAHDARNEGEMDTIGVYVQDMVYLNDRLDMEVGLRFDDASLEDAWYDLSVPSARATETVYLPDSDWDNFSPRIAFNYYTGPNSKLRIGYGSAFHAPPLEYLTLTMERRNGRVYYSNSALEPEEIDTYEIGIDHTGRLFSWMLNYYYSDAEDFIDYMPAGGGNFQADNVGRVEIQGVEFETGYKPTATTKYYFNSTWTSAKYEDYPANTAYEGKYMVDRPVVTGNVGMRYVRPDDESYTLNLAYVGSRYYDEENGPDSKEEAYFTLGLSASKNLGRGVTCRLDVRNIFKPKQMDDFRLPGEIWNLGVEYKF